MTKPFEVTGRHVLIAMLVFFGVIFAANGVFITMAVRTFPGLAADHPFKHGLAKEMNATFAARAEQAARGWTAEIDVAREGLVTLRVADADGAPVGGLDIEGAIKRPATQHDDRALVFAPGPEGGYVADAGALGGGVWIVVARTTFPDGAPFEATRRAWLR